MSAETKRAPVQRLKGGIPWDMHLRAYDAYSKRWAPQQAMIEGGCRGGFDIEELDGLIPGWREELEQRESVKMVRDPRSSWARPQFTLEPISPAPSDGDKPSMSKEQVKRDKAAAIASFTDALNRVPAREEHYALTELVKEGCKLLRALGVEPS